MAADLDAFQRHLEEHFTTLASTRVERGFPVFAFEHGLNSEDLTAISNLLQAALRATYHLDQHWLVWVIYATEQGYDYDGDEYWHTFERRMPLWDRSWRPALRNWFGRFRKAYGGLLPVGRWANFFSIIAWPITHALLPKDLQWQLARALYDLRYQLVSRLDQSPSDVGNYVARMARGGSSRFDNFLEQKELVGRIVIALLDHRIAGEDSSILPQALERIVNDLEKARNARLWLHDTRKAVEVARMRGLARILGGGGATPFPIQVKQFERKFSIRPSLLLRQTGANEWTPIVELPSLQPVADLSPELDEFLTRTRCTIAGAKGLRPPGWLLQGAQRRVLESWPPAGGAVVAFQVSNPKMEHLLASEGHISPGPTWLFRVGPDGQASEMVGRLLRPGHTYVLVSTSELPDLMLATSTAILCEGATGVKFALPRTLSAEQVAEFKAAELSVAKTIRIWPVGLAARGWDGEGATEWLESECPCFGIEHDHPIAEYQVRLGAGPPVTIAAKAAGVPTFIRLKPLPAGNHVLSVRVIGHSAPETSSQPVEGWVLLYIRPPNPWISGTIGHSGLIASSEPPEPTLDEFWGGHCQIEVLGPEGRQVSVCVELIDGSGTQIVVEQIGVLTLPFGPDTWRSTFATFEKRDKDPWGYLAASSGRVLIDGEELGTIRIPLRRDAASVRWVWRATNKSTQLRLVDDHDGEAPLHISFRSFAKPLEEQILRPVDVMAGIEPETPGGLFVAKYGDQQVPLVVGVRKVDGGFGGLLVEPDLVTVRPTREDAFMVVKAIIAWSDARVAGAFANERRVRVLERLKECLYCIMCGSNWADAERALREGHSREKAVELMIECFEQKRAFAIVLARDAVKFARYHEHIRQSEFTSLAHRYAIARGVASEPALALTDVLDHGLRPDDPGLQSMIEHLWQHPALTAGARIVQLLGRTYIAPASGAGVEA
jgi:hypothetical protein